MNVYELQSLMTMQMNECYIAPFVEDEYSNITAWGWVEKEDLIELVYYYDRHDDHHAHKHSVKDVEHIWVEARMTEHGEILFFACDFGRPNAFPAAAIWNIR